MFDIFAYVIGMLVRIQTIMLFVLTFGVETENVCIVHYDYDYPIPRELLPPDLSMLPGGFAKMSDVFQAILLMLFICSICTSTVYVIKVIVVCRNQGVTEQEYAEHVYPYVRRYKIWNTIFGLSHLACCTIFMTHAGRVCSGWTVS